MPLNLPGPPRTQGHQPGTREGHQTWERVSVRLVWSGGQGNRRLSARGPLGLAPRAIQKAGASHGPPGPPAPVPLAQGSKVGAWLLPQSGNSPRLLPKAPPPWTTPPAPHPRLQVSLPHRQEGAGPGWVSSPGTELASPLRHLQAIWPFRGDSLWRRSNKKLEKPQR